MNKITKLSISSLSLISAVAPVLSTTLSAKKLTVGSIQHGVGNIDAQGVDHGNLGGFDGTTKPIYAYMLHAQPNDFKNYSGSEAYQSHSGVWYSSLNEAVQDKEISQQPVTQTQTKQPATQAQTKQPATQAQTQQPTTQAQTKQPATQTTTSAESSVRGTNNTKKYNIIAGISVLTISLLSLIGIKLKNK